MKRKHQTRNFFCRSYWLVMALCCVVFSSAFKRLLEYNMEKHAYGQQAASQFINKKIKDGSRDKRQYLAAKVKPATQNPHNEGPDLIAVPDNRAPFVPRPFINIGPGETSFRYDSHLQVVTSLYLLHHRLQV